MTTTNETAPAPAATALAYTTFSSITDKSARQVQSTWADLVDKLTHPDAYANKKECPLLKLATFGDKRSPKETLHKSAVCVLGVSPVGENWRHETSSAEPQSVSQENP